MFVCSVSPGMGARRVFATGAAWATFISGQALASSAPQVCTAGDHYRLIEVVAPGADGAACEVKYRKSETGTQEFLWRSRNLPGFCQKKANELVAKLSDSGFTCAKGKAPGRNVAAPDFADKSVVVAESGDHPTRLQQASETFANAPANQSAQSGDEAAMARSTPGRSQKPTSDDGLIIEAIKNGQPLIDIRYRFEHKDQDGFARNAYANTLRTRIGYETGEFYNFKALAEFENIVSIGDDHFNSTTNARTEFPVIADPDATEVNRAQVTFTGLEKTPITIGRQRFNLNNHRFVGAVDFRQNQQTFDAARLSSTLIDNLTIDYLYVSRVHRIFGDDNPSGEFDSDSHVISAKYNAGEFGTIKGYGVLLDLEEAPGLSSATWGLRYENAFALNDDAGIKLGVVGEYAMQKDHAANPINYSEDYFHGEASLQGAPFGVKAGYEHLGGNGVIGFSTPLATLHKFQGFADVFLATPAAGIEDIYGTLSYAWKRPPYFDNFTLFATYHEFESESGNMDFGYEFDAGLALKFKRYWIAEIKGALYDGSSAFADRNIIWSSIRFQY